MFVLAGICRKHTPLSIRRILSFAGRIKCIGYILILYQLPLVIIVAFHKTVCFPSFCVIKQVIHMFGLIFFCHPCTSWRIPQRRVIIVKVLFSFFINLVLDVFCHTVNIIFYTGIIRIVVFFLPVTGIIYLSFRLGFSTNKHFCPRVP